MITGAFVIKRNKDKIYNKIKYMDAGKIIKCYLDIGCSYQGEEALKQIYQDIDNWNLKDYGIISILKLEIDKDKRIYNEILFRQVLSPMHHKFRCSIRDYQKHTLCILKEFKHVDLFVTFNGRDFDIPIIINNLNLSDKKREYFKEYILNNDRDLLDWCILKNIDVKGGLREIVKRLNINVNKKDNYKNNCCGNINNSYLLTKKIRNENDIKVLPLLEEKLGYLYEPRLFIDKYHKRWL